MNFDATIHKCVIVVDSALGVGHAANAASVIGVSLGRSVSGLVGPDMQSRDNVNYPAVSGAECNTVIELKLEHHAA